MTVDINILDEFSIPCYSHIDGCDLEQKSSKVARDTYLGVVHTTALSEKLVDISGSWQVRVIKSVVERSIEANTVVVQESHSSGVLESVVQLEDHVDQRELGDNLIIVPKSYHQRHTLTQEEQTRHSTGSFVGIEPV